MSSVSRPGLASPGLLCGREVESFMEFTQSCILEALSDTVSSVKSSEYLGNPKNHSHLMGVEGWGSGPHGKRTPGNPLAMGKVRHAGFESVRAHSAHSLLCPIAPLFFLRGS